jgi:hypothetical protein
MKKFKNDQMVRTVFDNTAEKHFTPFRKYYAFAQIEGKEVVLDYVGKYRSEALAALDEIARLEGGKLVSGVHVFK